MINELSIAGAFFTGLFGSVHCVAMCGGIICSLSLASNNSEPAVAAVNGSVEQASRPQQRVWRFTILYHIGRILSYMLAGFIVSGLGVLGYQSMDYSNAVIAGQMIASFFMLALGLYISQIWQGLLYFEKVGSIFWRLIAPVAKKLLPINRSDKALYAGVIWGWLPCGMVYSVLVWSFSSGNVFTGTAMMLAFGLGTLPMLLTISFFSSTQLKKLLNARPIRWLSGGIIISFSVWMLIATLTNQVHHH